MTHQSLPRLNFPPIKLRARNQEGSTAVWDVVRKCYIILTPEEWVRQHLVAFLASHLAICPTRMSLEYPVSINGQSQRADLVVMDSCAKPAVLAECKAPDVKITQHTLDQAVRYNSIVGARYIILTNGLRHHIYQRIDAEGGYAPLGEFTQMVL